MLRWMGVIDLSRILSSSRDGDESRLGLRAASGPGVFCRAVAWLQVFLAIAGPQLQLLPAAPVSTSPLPAVARPPAAPSPAARPVAVRRTLPPGVTSAMPHSAAPVLSAEPTADQLFRAALLPEAFVPVTGEPTPSDNRALAQALHQFSDRQEPEDVSALARFLERHPNSPWRVAVLVNLGLLHYQAGRFSLTFPAWEEAWRLGQNAAEPRAKALVDRAVAELIKMNARVGRIAALDALFAELGDRALIGSANEIVASAQQGLYRMKNEPWVAFRCGPFALDRIMAFENPGYVIQDCTYQSRSTTNGLSLLEVHALSRKMGMKMQPAKRQPGFPVLLPAVVNWKVGHYAALVKEMDGKYLVQDPTFGPQLWITRETLEQEASGYFLVQAGSLPQGWSAVGDAEASTVFGKGDVTSSDPKKPDSNEPQQPTMPKCAMTTYSGKLMSVSLHLQDTPVRYQPPRGPAIEFVLDYNQREQNQPANFTYANFGPKWTFNWVSYILDNPDAQIFAPSLYKPGGGISTFWDVVGTNNVSAPETESRCVLTRSSPTSYSLAFPDGTRHIFARPVGAAPLRSVFLTAIVDPHGNAVDLFYDATNRLVAVRDAIGQVSTIAYENQADIYKVTRITDPFGRFARFDYGTNFTITDVAGIQSTITYGVSGNEVNSVTTPYGTSRFRSGQSGATRWLEMTDPQGATERIEFRNQTPGIPFTDPTGVPKGINGFNLYMWSRNTYYWDKKAFREAAGDYTRARIYHWLHTENINIVSGILESEKQPLENRVWYNYPGQTWAGGVSTGMVAKPSKIGRILDDGSTQLYQYEYNALGNVTKAVDPMGRTTVYAYASNLMDLVAVRQTAGVNDLLQTRTYNDQHLPLTVADGSGHTNRFSYNSAGQLLTATNPRGDVTTLNYDTNGYLLSMDGPLPGTDDTTIFSYDGYGRARTVTDSEGYTLAYDYDVLDRLTRTTFPDGTYQENTYQALDLATSRDRNGRITRYTYDGNRRLVSVEDPLHRVTGYDWCSCGQMDALIDPMGRVTHWHRDLQSRVIAKEYADGSQVHYTYEGTTSRLKTVTDEKGQVKVYEYLPDNNLWRTSYLNAENPTPTVTFTYDGPYNRIKTMTDGIGLTTYGYYPASTNGGQLAWEDGPWANDTITYDYDELGRVRSRAIDAAAQRWTYDPLGRVTVLTNLLGAFTNTYAGSTFRLQQTRYPNGQWTDYAYYDNVGDQRLKEIHHRLPGNQTLSRFAYAYDPSGQITNWLQQAGSDVPEVWDIRYDAAQQLISVLSTTNKLVKKAYGYDYDPAGNRVAEDQNGERRSFAYDNLNAIQVASQDRQSAETYQWDAENRITTVTKGASRWIIDYDGTGRYSRVRHSANGAIDQDSIILWSGGEPIEERDALGHAKPRRLTPYGRDDGGDAVYYARDHLGTVRDEVNGAGMGLRGISDPWGYRADESAQSGIRVGFAGYYSLTVDHLLWTRFRVYSTSTGSWMSRDPIGESGGENLYAYVRNNPVNRTDPLGLLDAAPMLCSPSPRVPMTSTTLLPNPTSEPFDPFEPILYTLGGLVAIHMFLMHPAFLIMIPVTIVVVGVAVYYGIGAIIHVMYPPPIRGVVIGTRG